MSADLSADMFFDCSNGVISHLVELTPSKTPPKHISHVTELTPETTSLDAHSVWEIVYQRWQEDQRWQDDEQQDGASTETQIPELLFSLQTKTHASALSLKRFCDAENQASKTPARKWDDLRQPCMTWAYVLDKANNADNVNNSVNMEIDLGMTFDCGVPVVQRVCLSETNSPIQSGASVTSVEWFTHDPKLFPDNIVYHACNRPSDNSTTRSSAAQNASASDVSHQKRMLAHTYVLDMQAAEKIEADTNVTCVTQVTDTQNTPSSTAIQHIKVVHGQPTTEPGQVDFMYTTDATLLNYVGVLIDGVFVDGLLCLNQSAANPCNVAKKLAVTNNIADTKDRIQRISCINGWFTQSFTINVDEALRNNPNVELVCAFHNGNQLTGDEATAFVTKLTKNKQTGALTQHERKMHGGQPTHLQGGDTDPKFYELLVQAENAAQQAVHLCTVLQEEQDRGIVMDAREQASKLTTAKELAVLFARHLYNAFQILEQRPNDAGHTEGRQRTRELYKKYRQLLGPTLHKTLDKCLDFVPKPKR